MSAVALVVALVALGLVVGVILHLLDRQSRRRHDEELTAFVVGQALEGDLTALPDVEGPGSQLPDDPGSSPR